MANKTTVDVTLSTGSSTFPLNETLGLVETLAVQNIRNITSSSRTQDAFYEYPVENGKVIEEVVIEMASARAFDKTQPNFAPIDPVTHVKYFNNWEEKQFPITIRRNDIRKVIAKQNGVEEFATKILNSLTEKEGDFYFLKERDVLLKTQVKDFASLYLGGKVPASMKGVLYAIRRMVKAVENTNKNLTGIDYRSSVPFEDIRIALSTDMLNLIDVVELANIFNLTKEELMGKIVEIYTDDPDFDGNKYKVLVYDVKAFGRGTRLREYSQDVIGSGLYVNSYLTTDKIYFYNDLFKACSLDCTSACTSSLDTLLATA